MTKLSRSLLVFLGVSITAASSHAHAHKSWGGRSPSVFLTTDYRFEGGSFTGHRPAVQGSLYWAQPGNFYTGLWISNVDFSDLGDPTTSYETEIYGGRNFDIGKTRLTLE